VVQYASIEKNTPINYIQIDINTRDLFFGGAFAGFPKNHPCFIGLIIGIFVNGKVQSRK